MHVALWGDAAEHPIALVKAWCEVMGMRGGSVRAPSTNLSPEKKEEFKRRIREVMAETRSDPIFVGMG
jgi:dihydrodipicolinate synthase/N-acetylneuraminate lyase